MAGVTVFLAPGPFGAGGQFADAVGNPLPLGQIFTYLAGTTTPAPTYTSAAGTIQNANPIILGPDGRPPQEIWIPQGVAMKFVLEDVLGSPIGIPWDNLTGINDPGVGTVLSEWIAGTVPTFISANQFSVQGNQTNIYTPPSVPGTAGRRVQTFNTGGTIYGTVTASSFGAGITTVTLLTDSGVLDNGLSAVNYGIISGTNTSDPFNGHAVDIQIFVGPGTWIKPLAGQIVEVHCIGGGAPGGSAGMTGGGNNASGASAGAGGAHAVMRFRAADLPATVACTPGAAVNGPAGVTGSPTGTNGAAGNPSTFGTFLTAFGGGRGGGSVVIGGALPSGGGGGGTGGPGGTGGAGVGGTFVGGFPQPFQSGITSVLAGVGGGGGGGSTFGLPAEWGGGGGGASSPAGTGGGTSLYGGAGGGGGGGNNAGVATAGGAGGSVGNYDLSVGGGGGAGGANTGANGTAGANGNGIVQGQGGGGGGGNAAGNGGNGGNGGAPGGGGGGGGAASNTNTGGAGGAGARGEIRVYTYF